MASIEQLIFEIITRDRASDGLSKAGLAAKDAGANVDTLQRRLDELGRKTAQAKVELKGSPEAQADLDKISAKLLSLDRRTASPNLKVEGAARALAEMSALDLELDKIGGKGGSAQEAASSFSTLSGPSGMAGAIAAGTALSPVLLTVGLGLGGLAVAALQTVKNTGEMSKILAPLKAELFGFSSSLQPEVIHLFNEGVGLAAHLLQGVTPIAAATGKALGTVLGQIDAEFQSGTWQQFFGFMAKEAGPDVQLIGTVFTDLLADIPPLMTALQPLAVTLLTDADNTVVLIGKLAQLANTAENVSGHMTKAGGSGNLLASAFHNAWNQVVGGLIPGSDKLIPIVQKVIEKNTSASHATDKLGYSAKTAAAQELTLAQQVNAVTNAENKGLSPLLAYTNALIQQSNDATALNKALKDSHDRIGLNTAAQRASFSAAQTYIQDLLTTSSAAVKSHQGIDAQIHSIQSALPALEHVRGGTRQYWQEVQMLVNWLHQLQRIKQLNEVVVIKGQGTWATTAGGQAFPVRAAASGMYVNAGTGPTADDVLVRASRGELIVPANLVSAGAVSHLHGMIPGFAAGGIVGGYGGNLAGLQPWAAGNMNATLRAITSSIAGAMAAAVTSSFASGPAAYGSAAAAQAFARSLLPSYGWGGQWPALLALWNRESGWNPYAVNPSSGAYGIPQALGKGHPFSLGDYANQVRWGLSYIAGRYGNPDNAWSHEMAVGWYDQGGMLPVGASIALNTTGRPEPVGAGGNTYVINVGVLPGGEAEAGRRVVSAIRAFEKRSGKGWRS